MSINKVFSIVLGICPDLRLKDGTVERTGNELTFSCNSGKTLIGSNAATCNSVGQWVYHSGINLFYNSGVPECVGK